MADVKKINGYNVKDETARQMAGVVLWTNPNPNADFEGQDISMNLSAYDAIEIYCTDTLSSFTKVLKDSSAQLVALTASTISSYGCMGVFRNVDASANGVHFSNCRLIYTGVTGSDANNYLKPYKIVGYKFTS